MIGQNSGLTSLGIVVTFISTVQHRYPREFICMIDNFLPAAHNDFTLHLFLLRLPYTVTPPLLHLNSIGFSSSSLTGFIINTDRFRLSLDLKTHNCSAWYLERTSSRLCNVRIIFLPKEMVLTNASRHKPNSDSFPTLQLLILGPLPSTTPSTPLPEFANICVSDMSSCGANSTGLMLSLCMGHGERLSRRR